MTKLQRAATANQLIKTIAGCGRNFFSYPKQHGISRFEVDPRGRVWFVDGYTGRCIYLHYTYWGRGFSEGGTLRHLINALKRYITLGGPIPASNLGPWAQCICDGDLWGYGADMQQVRDSAVGLGIIIIKEKSE